MRRIDSVTARRLEKAQEYSRLAAQDLAAIRQSASTTEEERTIGLAEQVLTQAYVQIAGARQILEEVGA